MAATWTCGWAPSRVASAEDGELAIAVVGVCGASPAQLRNALEEVRAGRWRELTTWPGSYLVIGRRGGQTAVLGDLSGLHPLYWRRHEDGIWWSTAARALAALDPGHPGPDPVALAADLAFGQPDVLPGSRFADVARVPAGMVLLLDGTGARVERYEPLDYRSQNLAEAGPRVRAALQTAVAARCDGRPVSADLAGLDSTTLACLAAERGPVTAVTFADERLRDDDLMYARRTAAAVPALDHRVAAGSPATVYYADLHDIGQLPLTDAPNPYVVTASIKQAVLAAAAGIGPAPGTHFTGAAGDAVLSAPPTYLADLLREHRHLQLRRHAIGHARLRLTSSRTVMAAAKSPFAATLPGTWRQLAETLRQPAAPWSPSGFDPIAWTTLSPTAAWMQPEMRSRLADAVAAAADLITLEDAPQRLASYTIRQDLTRVGANTAGWAALARHRFGVELAAPYLDNEVIRACLAVPPELRGAPDRFKPLLSAAFAGTGLIPDHVLTRTTKGGYDGVAYAGIKAHAEVITDLLGPSSRLAGAGLIESAPISELLQRARSGLRVPQGALHAAVAAEVWLRQHDNAATWWQEVPAHAAMA